MGKMIDITGCKFGRWTVKELDIARNNKNKHFNLYWICECECGTIRSVLGYRLKKGDSQSCGCLQRELTVKKMGDLTGRTFGRWTVKELDIARNNENKSSNMYWICECECGTIKSVSGYALKNGGSQSCGCLRREQTGKKKIDITGLTFGRWTVKELDIARNNENRPHNYIRYWICECECGTIKSVSGYALRSGVSKSCGCLRRDRAKQRNIRSGKSLDTRQKLYKELETYLYDETNIAEKIPSDNAFGSFGVSFDTANNNWVASITVREKVYCKAYKTFSGAIRWRQKMEELLCEPVMAEFSESRMMK